MPRPTTLLLFPLCTTLAVADFVGPRYPYPKDLSSNTSSVQKAWHTISSTLTDALSSGANATLGDSPGFANLTFSLGIFSLEDDFASKSQFHYTSDIVKNAQNGSTKVDEDTLYQVASITKLFTVLAGKLNLNSTDWDVPLTKLFPSVAEFARTLPKEDNAEHVQWDKVTLAALSSQQAGIPTNPLALDKVASYFKGVGSPQEDGFPVFDFLTDPGSNPPPCGGSITNITCFFPSVAQRGPNHLPWAGPLYSNNGFILLTACLQAITGRSIPDLYSESIYNVLGLDSTFTMPVPDEQLGRAIYYGPNEIDAEVGLSVGSGGVVSSLRDLAKFGTGILNSTLLSSEETRRWMKPDTHTGRFEFSMGQPWEILRWKHESGAITDIYTKSGDSGTAGTYFVLIPDYNFGFTLLGSSPDETTKTTLVQALADLVSATLLPALEEQAQAEAEKNFAGTYFVSQNGTNSSLILSVNKTEGAAAGLVIDQYITNGVDQSKKVKSFFGAGARLQPRILTEGTGKLGFRVASAVDAPSVDKRKTLFSGFGRSDTLIGDGIAYGGNSLTEFIFDINKEGQATSVTPTILRATLKRKE